MIKAILQRKAVRQYSDEAVKQSDIDQLVTAFNAAPCGMHQTDVMQGLILVYQQLRGRIEKLTDNACYNAPLLFLLLVKADSPFGDRDASAAAENIMLQATDLGLASVYIMGAAEKINADQEIKADLQIPNDYRLSTIVAVGHAAKTDENPEDRTGRYQCRQL